MTGFDPSNDIVYYFNWLSCYLLQRLLIVSRYLTGIIPVHKLNIVILHGYIPLAHVISMENFTPSNYPQKYVGLPHVFKTMCKAS